MYEKVPQNQCLSEWPEIGKRGVELLDQVSPEVMLYNIGHACQYLNVSRSTLDKLRQDGYLSTVRLSKSVRFLEWELRQVRNVYSIPKGKV